jgi:hypothetical protein
MEAYNAFFDLKYLFGESGKERMTAGNNGIVFFVKDNPDFVVLSRILSIIE